MDWNAELLPFVVAGAVLLGLLFVLVLLWLHEAEPPITTPWDTRLPQSYEWDDLLPAAVAARLWQLVEERNVCSAARVPAIDAALIALLVPYRRDRG